MAATNEQDSRKEQFEKVLRKNVVFGEDSSDEEDDVSGYDVKQKLREFEDKNKFNDFMHKKLSFIIYAVAIKFLYSSDIQNAYYEKKKKFRCYEAGFGYEQLESAIEKTAEQIVDGNEELIFSAVKNTISTKIYGDLAEFFIAFRNENLGNFFENFTIPGGFSYKTCDLLKQFSILLPFEKIWDEARIFAPDSVSNYTEFFAKLRLHNKLAKKRMIFEPITKQKTFTVQYKKDNPVFKWKYSNATPSLSLYSNVFISNEYNENNVKTEYVVFTTVPKKEKSTSYENLWKECRSQLGDIKKLRIFTSEVREINKYQFATQFHCLLFGLEIMRNPSALIHHMMLFDLIEGEQIGWEEVHKIMPMAFEGAVEASRYKNSVYGAYMPHNYSYDVKRHKKGIESTLFDRELDLTKKWLENNLSTIIEEGDIKDEYLDCFFKKLQEACKAFYNIEAF